MNSNLDNYLEVWHQWLQHLTGKLGSFAGLVFGVLLVAFISAGVIAFRWILQGGLGSMSRHKFFAERREIENWLNDH